MTSIISGCVFKFLSLLHSLWTSLWHSLLGTLDIGAVQDVVPIMRGTQERLAPGLTRSLFRIGLQIMYKYYAEFRSNYTKMLN